MHGRRGCAGARGHVLGAVRCFDEDDLSVILDPAGAGAVCAKEPADVDQERPAQGEKGRESARECVDHVLRDKAGEGVDA